MGGGRPVPEEQHQPFVVEEAKSGQEYLQTRYEIPYAHAKIESREAQDGRMVGSESSSAPETRASRRLLLDPVVVFVAERERKGRGGGIVDT